MERTTVIPSQPLSSGRRFAVADRRGFLRIQRLLEAILGQPEGFKAAGTALGHAANGALHLVGVDSALLDFFGHPHTHPLGETYASHAALRHGAYVAKLRLVPASPELRPLAGATLDPGSSPSALREAVAAFFRAGGAEYELQAQLRTSEETMPVEDASVEWPEDESPYLAVARVSFPPQAADGEARRAVLDDQLSFTPAHSLAAHRPLGSLMRGRLKAYGAIAAQRAALNASLRWEPRSIDQVAD